VTRPAAYLTPRMVMRPMAAAEAPALAAFLRANRRFLEPWGPVREDSFYTTEATARRLGAEDREYRAGRALPLYLFSRAGGDLLGSVTLSSIVRGPFQSAFLGYKLAAAATGHGFMTEAVSRVVRIAFETLNLHRVEANVMPRNRPSRAVLDRCGFDEEGASREYLRINGRWEDHLHYVILNDAWRPVSPA